VAAKTPYHFPAEARERSVEDIAQELWEHANAEGVYCPCCRQLAKVYRRAMTGSMAYAAVLLAKYFQAPRVEPWLHVPSYLASLHQGPMTRGGDWAKLRYWGIIEQMPGERKDGSPRTGMYRMTKKGVEFARNEIMVPRRVVLYNDLPLGFDGRQVTCRECLGTKFNYAGLMAAT
jgi:hypothetical protein